MNWTSVLSTDSVSGSGHPHWHCGGLSCGSISRCFGLIRLLTSSNGAGCLRKDAGGAVCVGRGEADWWLPSALCWNMIHVCNRSFRCKQSNLSVWIWGSESVTFAVSPANPASSLWPVFLGGGELFTWTWDVPEVSWGRTDVQIIRLFGSRNYGYQMFSLYLDKILIFSEQQQSWCV